MVQAVVCRTWLLGSFIAVSRKPSPMLTSATSLSTDGPSKMDPNANVAASRFRQSFAVVRLSMLLWARTPRRSGRTPSPLTPSHTPCFTRALVRAGIPAAQNGST